MPQSDNDEYDKRDCGICIMDPSRAATHCHKCGECPDPGHIHCEGCRTCHHPKKPKCNGCGKCHFTLTNSYYCGICKKCYSGKSQVFGVIIGNAHCEECGICNPICPIHESCAGCCYRNGLHSD